MNLTDITTAAGKYKKARRIGRGAGSGAGKTSGRGTKGGGARAGWKARALSEGGQMPIFRRLPKRGFTNALFKRDFEVVNVADLEVKFEAGAHVTRQALLAAGLIRRRRADVKILGDGELTKKLTVEAARFSETARKKIAAAGGEVKVV